MVANEKFALSKPFVARRLHSLFGFWLVIYLFEHLFVNAQVAFYPKDDGNSFIYMVNKIHATPYLKLIEILLIAIPFLYHGIWGMFYAKAAKLNSFSSSSHEPRLLYARNRAFSWQRITSWILVVAILGHVVHMRFLEMPGKVVKDGVPSYFVKQKPSNMLYLMVEKLHFKVYTASDLEEKKKANSCSRKKVRARR